MINDVKGIVLVFNNMESVYIHQNDIGIFSLRDIQMHIGRQAVNAIQKDLFVHDCFIELLPSVEQSSVPDFHDGHSILERVLSVSDISFLEIHYEDGRKEEYFIPWEGEHFNTNQTSKEQSGCAYISINKHKTVTNVIKEINK